MKFLFSFLFTSIAPHLSAIDIASTQSKIESLSRQGKFRVGVAAWHLETGKEWSFQGDQRHALASVYKLPIALALLREVEKGKTSLDQKIFVSNLDILGGYKGPLAKKHPKGGVKLPIAALLKYMVANSDNSACDLILKEVGGPRAVTEMLVKWGYENISIDRYERKLIKGNDPGPGLLDTATANALTKLIGDFWLGRILSKKHTALLKDLMTDPRTLGHIESGLPKGTPVVHKSGWCSGDQCINDTAVIQLPNRKGHVALTVFTSAPISDSKLASQTIGKVARVVFEAALLD